MELYAPLLIGFDELLVQCTNIKLHAVLICAVCVVNRSLAEKLPISVSPDACDSPHTKTHLLLQAHFSSTPLPIADYVTDTKSVLDQALRILQVSPSVYNNFIFT